jgi:hypothetical protein
MPYTVVDLPTEYFNTKLYTGTGASNAVTGVGFQPDWVWIKVRSNATHGHNVFDVIRGVNKNLQTNGTSAEGDDTSGSLTAFNSDGFTLGGFYNKVNQSGETFVAWNWLASNTTVSNTSGSITSTVSANTTSGFSIVSYTGTGALATVGHGLGTTPAMIIVKSRTSVTNWNIYHQALGNTKSIYLNLTNAPDTTATRWNNTSPTSTVFTVNTSGEVNGSAVSLIAYCFAEVKGFSKFGSYTGNGSTDGTFVYTGFKPAYVMVKASSTTGQWAICDNKRGAANILGNNGEFLFAENSDATNSAPANWDFLSNGFKARANYAAHNTSGVTYIYMAFAENPFVTSGGIPVTAR